MRRAIKMKTIFFVKVNLFLIHPFAEKGGAQTLSWQRRHFGPKSAQGALKLSPLLRFAPHGFRALSHAAAS